MQLYVDHGLTGTNRERPGLREALAACRNGDTLVVTKLDRLARSLTDAREILEDLTRREVKLSIGGQQTRSAGCCSTTWRWSEFESDLRTKEGMRVGVAKGHLRGRQPKLDARQQAHLVALHDTGEHSTAELGELLGVGRSTVYRAIERETRRSEQAGVPRNFTVR